MVFGGILAVIGAITHGIGTVLGKTWDVVKSFTSWLFAVLPRPLKFFFFLYMIIFVTSVIMPKFIGTQFACDSSGEVYKINFLDMYVKSKYVDAIAEECQYEEAVQEESSFFFVDWLLSLREWGKKTFSFYGVYQVYTKTGNVSDMVGYDICSELKGNDTINRDYVLQYFGEKPEQKDYRQVVHIGCSQDDEGEYYTSLHFFNLDIFNFEMWLMLGIIGLIIPFAFKWYSWVHKR